MQTHNFNAPTSRVIKCNSHMLLIVLKKRPKQLVASLNSHLKITQRLETSNPNTRGRQDSIEYYTVLTKLVREGHKITKPMSETNSVNPFSPFQ